MAEIAAIRGLTEGTVKSHLARWIATGEVDIHEVLPEEMIEAIMACIEEKKETAAGAIRRELGDKYDYSDIRMIVSHALRMRNSKPAEP